jgi:hypothetical protein
MIDMRKCNQCQISKEEINFRLCKYKNGNTYYKSCCKLCEKQNSLQFARTHKKERAAYQQQYTKDHPNYKKNWRKENREQINQQERDRRITDINFRLKKNVSRAISHAIHKDGKSTFDYLPYSTEELKSHLEALFDEKMNWDNYGSYWHIDHIIPHSLFHYISMNDMAFKQCWSLNNLRPLEAKQNMLDGATRIRHKG